MESLPAAGTVRRTVRVAVALVVGQALLCALIGWLTLGRGQGSAATVDQMAAPPAPASTATSRDATPAPSPPAQSPTTATPPATPGRKTADRKVDPTPSRAASPAPAPADPAPLPPAPPSIAVPELPDPTIVVTSTTVPGRALVPPMPSPTLTEAPGPVTVGDRCLPEGAFARTADGDLVRCVRTWRHRARWKIV